MYLQKKKLCNLACKLVCGFAPLYIHVPVKCKDVSVISLDGVFLRLQSHRLNQLHLP